MIKCGNSIHFPLEFCCSAACFGCKPISWQQVMTLLKKTTPCCTCHRRGSLDTLSPDPQMGVAGRVVAPCHLFGHSRTSINIGNMAIVRVSWAFDCNPTHNCRRLGGSPWGPNENSANVLIAVCQGSWLNLHFSCDSSFINCSCRLLEKPNRMPLASIPWALSSIHRKPII